MRTSRQWQQHITCVSVTSTAVVCAVRMRQHQQQLRMQCACALIAVFDVTRADALRMRPHKAQQAGLISNAMLALIAKAACTGDDTCVVRQLVVQFSALLCVVPAQQGASKAAALPGNNRACLR